MVTSTRRPRIVPIHEDRTPEVNVSTMPKRRNYLNNTVSKDTLTKRRKTERRGECSHDGIREERYSDHKGGEQAVREIPSSRSDYNDNVEGKGSKRTSASIKINGTTADAVTDANPIAKGTKHIRFGSEEPVTLTSTDEHGERNAAQMKGENEVEQPESGDDEAPEAIDNFSQLRDFKNQAQKVEDARKRDKNMQKEKRRFRDEMHKSQAKTSGQQKHDAFFGGLSDRQNTDYVSESSATFQGSIRMAQKPVLPALLPDDILNAEPSDRFLTLSSGIDDSQRQRPHKLRFIENADKPPKDIYRDGVMIRVIGDSSVKKKSGAALPPKISKSSHNLKQAWMAGRQWAKAPAGLRRTTSGPTSFVHRR